MRHTPEMSATGAWLRGRDVGLAIMCREVFGKCGFGIVYPVAALVAWCYASGRGAATGA